jgi:hypothetical protein
LQSKRSEKLMFSFCISYRYNVVKKSNVMQGDRPDISCAGLKQRIAPTVVANHDRKKLHTS